MKNDTPEKRKQGRPSRYKSEFDIQALKLCRLGAIDTELADFFEIDLATLNRWKLAHPSFCESLKTGKQYSDAEVADKLFKRATGYSHEEVDIKMYEGAIIKTKLIKRYPPDTVAAIFWLKNRNPERWRDKKEIEVPGGLTVNWHEEKTVAK